MSLYIIDNNAEPVEITPSAISVKGGAVGDIADVEHIETIYDVINGKTSLGSGNYVSGIQGGVEVTGCDFSKYKKLIITTKFNNQQNVSVLPFDMLSNENAMDDYQPQAYIISPISASYDAPKDTHLAVILVNKEKNNFRVHRIGFVQNGVFNSRSTSNWCVVKIEGVY